MAIRFHHEFIPVKVENWRQKKGYLAYCIVPNNSVAELHHGSVFGQIIKKGGSGSDSGPDAPFLKGTVSRDFRPSVFIVKLYPWVP
jgi:hypothetical protein